jgi:thiamine kinase-like enzyme
MARALTWEDAASAERHAAIDFDAMAAEVDAVEALCARTRSPVVFCHNDLLPGNILAMDVGDETELATLPAEELRLQLIDFEYGCYSHRGFDWGAPACALF